MMKIREATSDDGPAVAELTIQLGYPADSDVMSARLARLQHQENQLVLVATEGENVVGWIQAHASDVLESGWRVEIVGLVVSASCRRQGIGRVLVQQMETWAMKVGAATIVVRSNLQRVESHRFYPSLGYEHSKTQAVYRKKVARDSNLASTLIREGRNGSV